MTKRHRAIHRYKTGKHRGKVISRREIARRIAQSMGVTMHSTLQSQTKHKHSLTAGDTVIVS